MNLHELHQTNAATIRETCKERLESLEHWLRRLIDDLLTSAYGDYFNYMDEAENRVIKKKVAEDAANRASAEPKRFPRAIDAVFLNDAIDILCRPDLYKKHFRPALELAFPEGAKEARTFMSRLIAPRNHLAHANAISVRQAEQIICYSNDVIESLKSYYLDNGMQQDYNVPLILKSTDSFGNVFTRSQMTDSGTGLLIDLKGDLTATLRPDDTLTVELEVDPSFDAECYSLEWTSSKGITHSEITHNKISIPITNKQVGERFDVQCRLTTTNEWHRMQGYDDLLILVYKVLPPIGG